MKRIPYIAGNWKMNMLSGEADAFFEEFLSADLPSSVKIMIAPPFTALNFALRVAKSSSVLVGAQNIGPAESGAYTGEVSAAMLQDLGVSVVILGHSERRSLFDESDEDICRKLHLAISSDLDVILCVGETLEEREANRAEKVVARQLRGALDTISDVQFSRIVIAYEPVWAIGTGKTASPEDAESMHAYIRNDIATLYSTERAEAVSILYGGSVKPGNADGLMAMANIDGALVGGASLNSDSFIRIIKSAAAGE